MIKRKMLIAALVAALVATPACSQAQKSFFYNFNASTGNIWSNAGMTLATGLLLKVPETSYLGVYGLRLKDEEGKLNYVYGNPFWFKSHQLFNHITIGGAVGFKPEFSIIGVYVRAKYEHDEFKAQLDRSIEELDLYKLNTVTLGFGARIASETLREEWGWSPIVEVGCDWNRTFAGSTPYGKDVEQFNTGYSSQYAAGVYFGEDQKYSALLSYTHFHYNLFNNDYTTPDGATPYSGIFAKRFNLCIVLQTHF